MRVKDIANRFTEKQINEILSEKNRRETRESLKRDPTTAELVHYWAKKKAVLATT